jgi:hypothetical protein
MPSDAVRRLAEVDALIEGHEAELSRLGAERARLLWILEEGDHS